MSAKRFVGLDGEEEAAPSEAVLERVAVEGLIKRLSVFRQDVANVITVSFSSEDPEKAAKIANAVADTYLASIVEAKNKSTKVATQWLQDRLTELKMQAIEADRTLQNYKIANNLLDPKKAQEPRPVIKSANAIEQRPASMADAKADSSGSNRRSAKAFRLNVTDALNNSVIVRLRSQYLDLAAKASEIESRVGPEHLAVARLHERMNELLASIWAEEQRLAGAYASEYQIAKARENRAGNCRVQATRRGQKKAKRKSRCAISKPRRRPFGNSTARSCRDSRR